MRTISKWMLVGALLGALSLPAEAHIAYTGYSGAPGTLGLCAESCHGTSGGTIQVSGFPLTYVPGQSYTITVARASGNSIANFNGSCRLGNGSDNAGVVAAGTNTATYNTATETNGIHLSAGNKNSGTFTWTAPAAGSGSVTLYLAGIQGTSGGPNTSLTFTAAEAAPTPTGACCTLDGACTVTTQAACLPVNAWQGAGTVCSPNPCPQPPPPPPPTDGACCAPDGACTVTAEADCAVGSTWQGLGTICSPNPCLQPPPPTDGACCAPDGACTVTAEADCAVGNTWQGAGTICAPNPCPQPPPPPPPGTGACCRSDGSCRVVTQDRCRTPNVWQGAGTTCDPNPCTHPQEGGACCLRDGSCRVMEREDCDDHHGTYRGDGSVCSPSPCHHEDDDHHDGHHGGHDGDKALADAGGCCLSSGGCVLVANADCDAQGGTFQGPASSCSPDPCSDQPTEKTTWGRVKSRYRN